jgi:nucleoside-diphosphate-sugar epimerase
MMKVLITGGYGFIGSHTAERFYKEGYKIYIMDNLSTGHQDNVSIEHKFYKMDIGDQKCEEIFANNEFDVVVHLAAQNDEARSLEQPFSEAESNILGLINILHLSSKYGVKKFIFASSGTVYGNFEKPIPFRENDKCNPLSPYGVSKLAGEQYCRLWRQTYNLETISLRFSNVYGPRQRLKSEGGVVATFMNNLFNGETLLIHGTGEQTRDFIYVGDAVEAIYRSVEAVSADTLNISANINFSVKDLVNFIKNLHRSVNIEYTLPRNGDVMHSRLSNHRAKLELQWSPKYTLDKGLEKTYEWYKDFYSQKKPKIEKKSEFKEKPKKGAWLSKMVPYLESFASFGLVVFLSTYAEKHGIRTPVDFPLIYIIIMGTMYGLKHSTIATVLSCVLFVWQMRGTGDLLYLIYNINTLVQFGLYIFVGSVLGYSVDANKNQAEAARVERDEIKGKFDFLYEMYLEGKIVRKELQDQITNTEDSFGKIVQITSVLDSLEPEKVFGETVGIIERMMRSKDVYIYSVSRNQAFLRLNSKSLESAVNAAKSLRVDDVPEIKAMMETKAMFINKKLIASLPMMMSPVVVDNKVVAVIAIYNMEFEAMSLYKQNLLKVVTSLITSALARAYQYDQAIYDEKYFSGTSVFKSKYFAQLLKSKAEAKQSHGIEFTVLLVRDSHNWGTDLAYEVEKGIREVDYLGVNEKNELLILLSNTQKEEAAYVISRLQKKDIKVELLEEGKHDAFNNRGTLTA